MQVHWPTITCTIYLHTFLAVGPFYCLSPKHVIPSPVKPYMQVQVKLPGVLVQYARPSLSQLDVPAVHSSISIHNFIILQTLWVCIIISLDDWPVQFTPSPLAIALITGAVQLKPPGVLNLHYSCCYICQDTHQCPHSSEIYAPWINDSELTSTEDHHSHSILVTDSYMWIYQVCQYRVH